MSGAALEYQHVSVRYPGVADHVVCDFSLAVPAGSTCAIIGPSGCGKSTLLKAAADLIHLDSGKVMVGGKPTDPKSQRIGYMPQSYGLLPWRTVDENIALGIRVKYGTKADSAAVENIKNRLGIGDIGNRYPGELSGGQQQRAALARAFLLSPDVLLMDEPFSALDAITRDEMQDVFLSLWNSGHVTTLLVTHYVDEAIYLGQKIVVLSARGGRILEQIDNPLFGYRKARDGEEFLAMSSRLRGLIKKAAS